MCHNESNHGAYFEILPFLIFWTYLKIFPFLYIAYSHYIGYKNIWLDNPVVILSWTLLVQQKKEKSASKHS